MQAEVQKVNTQKEYFEHTIAELEKDLRDAIDSADTTERDMKYALFVSVNRNYCIRNHNVTQLVCSVIYITSVFDLTEMTEVKRNK